MLLLGALLAGWPNPWGDTDGLDVQVISHGEAVELEDHLVQGKFTVIDVGASWCAPCHDAAHRPAAEDEASLVPRQSRSHPDELLEEVGSNGLHRRESFLALVDAWSVIERCVCHTFKGVCASLMPGVSSKVRAMRPTNAGEGGP